MKGGGSAGEASVVNFSVLVNSRLTNADRFKIQRWVKRVAGTQVDFLKVTREGTGILTLTLTLKVTREGTGILNLTLKVTREGTGIKKNSEMSCNLLLSATYCGCDIQNRQQYREVLVICDIHSSII